MPSPPANANGHRRRQVRARVLAEETHCALCSQPVDKSLTVAWGQHGRRCKGDGCPGCVPHPMRAEVDEVLPRSRGGDPLDRSGCVLMHRQCNLLKSGRTLDEMRQQSQPAASTGAFNVTRAW